MPMNTTLFKKYRQFPQISLPDRQWPNRAITAAPIWCSVDLRDGNQALPMPMNVSQKFDLFKALVRCGFKQVEVGFPSSSDTEFAFIRQLIEGGHIPDDVTIQALVQAREDLIERTFQSLLGIKRAIIHVYNSTSPAQRRVVFGLDKPGITAVATRGVRWIKDRLPLLGDAAVTLEYSPESFSATEVEFALEVCHAVMDVWQPTSESKIIINLPATVEVATPNVYADQVEWFIRNLSNRRSAIVSVHTHNDRGTGTACTELGLLAGAERVEGTLFGNGERTGNVDIITIALNLFTQGIEPGLDFTDLNALKEVYERATGMMVPPRHPYAGELVFTAFSGSHQDAIKKGLAEWQTGKREFWDVPYLPIDPGDIGRKYQEVIRVTSQSGKGGVAYLLESRFGIKLPKDMQREFGPIANRQVDTLAREVKADELRAMFEAEYINRVIPWTFLASDGHESGGSFSVRVSRNGEELNLTAPGKGPIEALVHALIEAGVPRFEVAGYEEHALGSGEAAQAIAYVGIKFAEREMYWGAGIDDDIKLAPMKALFSALNRASVS